MSYDNDGTVVGKSTGAPDTVAARFAAGVSSWLSGSDVAELNDYDNTPLADGISAGISASAVAVWFFFPESREVTAHAAMISSTTVGDGTVLDTIAGSADTTNGVDGTWEVATLTGGYGSTSSSLDGWRRYIKPISFTGPKRVVRIGVSYGGNPGVTVVLFHLYGEKAAGQTPHDLIFINHQDTPGVEYTAPQDFGDRPLGTTTTHEFRVKNASATLTANSINLQCNDTDFAISTDGSTWVATINIASLAAGAESATMYVRCTTPNPGALLGPRFARIIAIVGSWS